MNRDIDDGLTPFTTLNHNQSTVKATHPNTAWDDALEALRRMYQNPDTSDEQRDTIWNNMWELYVNTHFPDISRVNPDAAWVDKDGNVATLYDNNGAALPLTKDFNHLASYLHNLGFAHLNEIPQNTPKEQRGWDFRMYDEPVPISPFYYGDKEDYEPPILIPNREIYDDVRFRI